MEPYINYIVVLGIMFVFLTIVQLLQLFFVFDSKTERILDNSMALIIVLIIIILGFRFMDYLHTLNTFLI